MTNKKSFWHRLWESEDNQIFGELFLIAGSVMVTKALDQILPNTIKWLIYLGIGF